MTAIPTDPTPDSAQPEPVLSERLDGVLRLTLNRPEKRNTLSVEMLTALKGAVAE
ncbi:MAG: enoyl-CoA hydratase, partial [SAR324 cluster bacterium]|nr:enoyl-CoA hydratase [SAR324 cluster bacterium]